MLYNNIKLQIDVEINILSTNTAACYFDYDY